MVGGTRRRRGRSIGVLGIAALLAVTACAGPADTPRPSDSPGADATWSSGAKTGIGTSTTSTSKLWYTLGDGVADEVYYPQADTPDVQDMRYLVTDGATFTDDEKSATTHEVTLTEPRALTYRQVNTARNGRYRITKTYATDPARATLLVQTRFQVLTGGPLRLYLRYDPSLNNSGMGDSGETVDGVLRASDGPVASALAASTGFTRASSGYVGTPSDGARDLAENHTLSNSYADADTAGNLVQTAQIPVGKDTTFTVALGFGGNSDDAARNAAVSLSIGWDRVSNSYRNGWHEYLDSVSPAPASVTGAGLTATYNTAVMALKAHEDKTYRGAFVASLSVPWGEAIKANDCCAAGYHAVWSRDLYEMATAEAAIGDTEAAHRALDYLITTQERPDGSYPQNTRLNGAAVYPSLQLDEVAYPIILAWQLGRTDDKVYAKVKLSAEYLAHHGPRTPQERWEETGGYSPSTIAAEIAGLVCAAELATVNKDAGAAAFYLQVADDWRRQLDGWTFTTTGSLAGHGYYERIDDNGNPNDGHQLAVANGGGSWDERDVVDAGFLELARLGVVDPRDSHITDSLPVVDATIRTATPAGDMWHRYNHDGYGESADGAPWVGNGEKYRGKQGTHFGRAWPLLTGERGEYELALGDAAGAQSRLAALAGTANAGGMIPEQVWDQPDAMGFTLGKGTGSATPLIWAEAQFARLAVSISAGHNVETPSVVATRYLR